MFFDVWYTLRMKKIIVSILALALIIGVIISVAIFIKDQEIKATLDGVEESNFVEGDGVQNLNSVDSEISITRTNGEWSISETGEYTIDPSSLVFEFTGYKVGGEHIGTFNDLTSSIALDESGIPVALGIKIMPESVKTDEADLDAHLQDAVFFNTAQYPEIQVVVKGITEEDGIKAVTDITIKGITKTVAIPVMINASENEVKFSIDTTIKISEWDIGFGPVKDDVRVVVSGVVEKK